MRLLYFAWLRQHIGTDEEDFDIHGEELSVQELIQRLRQRGDGYLKAFEDLDAVRVAVNQDFAQLDDRVGPDDEVAFFPPVTGGKW